MAVAAAVETLHPTMAVAAAVETLHPTMAVAAAVEILHPSMAVAAGEVLRLTPTIHRPIAAGRLPLT
jgi:hypothetical protein